MRNILLLSIFFTIGSCQDTTNTVGESKEFAIESTTKKEAKTTTFTEQAKTTLTTAPAANPKEITQLQPLTTYIKKKMTEGLWHYETAVVVGKPEQQKAYNGKWIQFNPDNTILSGFYEEEGHAGTWVYDEGKDILTVLEGGERPSYTQWKLQFSSNSDDLAIWVGTKRFQNNNTQIKMLRRVDKPKK